MDSCFWNMVSYTLVAPIPLGVGDFYLLSLGLWGISSDISLPDSRRLCRSLDCRSLSLNGGVRKKVSFLPSWWVAKPGWTCIFVFKTRANTEKSRSPPTRGWHIFINICHPQPDQESTLLYYSPNFGRYSFTYRSSHSLIILTASSAPKNPFTLQVPGFLRSL